MIKDLYKKANQQVYKVINYKEEEEVKKLTANQKPIYHVHIRKTAGTTINFAFLSNANQDNVETFYGELSKKRNQRMVSNSKVFVGWNDTLLNEGNYSYGFSHTPLHALNLPTNIFKFTCLRDPVKRVISHYNMLMHFQKNKINHPCMKTEGKWLGNSILDFVSLSPKYAMLNQLYMFSKRFDINEASDELSKLDCIMFTEKLSEGLKRLEKSTGWLLPISNQKKYNHKELISQDQMQKIKELLKPEYTLLEKFM